MKQLFYLLILGSAFMYSCKEKPTGPLALYDEIDLKAQPNTLTESEQKAGWQMLFDGTSPAGWHGYNQAGIPASWAVEDGALTMNSTGSGEEQDIITDKSYKNFAFTVEYKITSAANSGVLFQIKEDTLYKFAYETGPEMQIIDDAGWPGKLEDWQTSGANYAMYPAKEKPAKPVGEWNRLMIIVKGNDVTQILNGVVVVQYTKYSDEWNKLRNSGKWTQFPDWGKYDEGHISLQNHGTKVWFRDVMVKEL